jgi:hypothetical protein
MAKFKLVLGALPDFKLPIEFVMINGEKATITFTAKHRKSKDIQEILQRDSMSEAEFIKELCVAWDLEEEFNDENIEELCGLFPSSVLSLTNEYMKALAGQRTKN